jgi:hypothetical protein
MTFMYVKYVRKVCTVEYVGICVDGIQPRGLQWLRIIGAIIENVIRYDVVIKTAVRRTWYI